MAFRTEYLFFILRNKKNKKKKINKKLKKKKNHCPTNFRLLPQKVKELSKSVGGGSPLASTKSVKFDMTWTILIVLFRNAGFEILTSYWLVIAQDQHYDVREWSDFQRQKKIAISEHDVCGNNSDLKTPYIVYLKYIFFWQAKAAKRG